MARGEVRQVLGLPLRARVAPRRSPALPHTIRLCVFGCPLYPPPMTYEAWSVDEMECGAE